MKPRLWQPYNLGQTLVQGAPRKVWFQNPFRPKITSSTRNLLSAEGQSAASTSRLAFFIPTIRVVFRSRLTDVNFHGEVWPLQSDELQSHMVAVGNRVLLRCGDDAFVGHTKLSHFIASSFVRSVLNRAMVHRPNDDFLLAFALFASRIEEFTFCPRWNCAVAVSNLSFYKDFHLLFEPRVKI